MESVSVLSASGLGLRTRRGWVFRDVDVEVGAGELVAVTGAARSGRTSLLLALAGRFATSSGSVRRAGRADLGYVPGVTDLEGNLTLRDHLRERRLLVGRRAVQVEPEGRPDLLARDATPLERQLWGLKLALVGGPAVVLVDDVDAGLTAAERDELWGALRKLTTDGTAVVAVCREAPEGVADHIIALEASS